MSSKRQSSIDWLVRKLSTEFIGEIPIHRWDEIRDAVQQAKQLHEQEIIDAWEESSKQQIEVSRAIDWGDDIETITPQQYYQYTYGE